MSCTTRLRHAKTQRDMTPSEKTYLEERILDVLKTVFDP